MELFSQYWDGLDSEVRAAIITIILTFAGDAVRRVLVSKPRIKWGVSHQHSYRVNNSEGVEFLLNTREIWIQNVGGKKSENIEVALNYRPQRVEFWPPIEMEEVKLADGRPLFKFKHLQKGRHFCMYMLDGIGELPEILYIRHQDGDGLEVKIGINQQFGFAIKTLVAWLLFFGAISSVYWFIRLIQLIG